MIHFEKLIHTCKNKKLKRKKKQKKQYFDKNPPMHAGKCWCCFVASPLNAVSSLPRLPLPSFDMYAFSFGLRGPCDVFSFSSQFPIRQGVSQHSRGPKRCYCRKTVKPITTSRQCIVQPPFSVPRIALLHRARGCPSPSQPRSAPARHLRPCPWSYRRRTPCRRLS